VEVAAAGVTAFDPVGGDRFLDEGEGVQAGLVELAAPVTVALEQRAGTGLEAGLDHAAVAAAGTPAELMLLQERDRTPTRRQPRCGHRPGIAAADDHDINLRRKGGWLLCLGRGFPPPVGLLAIVRSERGHGSEG